ncbi:MAG: LamG domain-containing protein, partial [Victivallales bacterium]|nr:LamG domain-containing protein [Victivallales bacterium]
MCVLGFCVSLAAAPLPNAFPLSRPGKPLFFSLALRHTAGAGKLGLTLDGKRHLTKPVFVGVGSGGRLRVRLGEKARDGDLPLPKGVRLVGRLDSHAGDGLRLSVLAKGLGESLREPKAEQDWSLALVAPLRGENLGEYFLDFVNGASGQFLDVAFGSSWADVAKPLAGGLSSAGRFGGALDARTTVGTTTPRPEFGQRVFTVEAWAKLRHDGQYNILLAHAPKSSDAHWELYTERSNGAFAVYMPANKPAVMTSPVVITDDRWHHMAMVAGVQTIRLFVDGKEVLKAPHVRGPRKDTRAWGLTVGALHERSLRCNGLIDEIRLSHGARSIGAMPKTASEPDESTFALWHLDAETTGNSPNAVASGPALTLESERPSLAYPTIRRRVEPAAEPFSAADASLAIGQFGLLHPALAVGIRAGVLRHWGEQYRELQDQLAGRQKLPAGAAAQTLDPHALIQEADADPAGVVLRRTQALLARLRQQHPDRDFGIFAADLDRIGSTDRRAAYLAACIVRRRLMLSHPLLDFDRVLFAKRGTYAGSRLTKAQNRDPEGGHFANQYFGFNTIPDGGLYVA